MATINMLSHADSAKGHGVLSAYTEQVALVKNGLTPRFEVFENSIHSADILHMHTVNPTFFVRNITKKKNSVSVGYVHFLPETLEQSLQLPPLTKVVFYRYLIAFYKSCDYLVIVNPCFIPRLEIYGIRKEKVRYIPNFVASEGFYKIEDKVALREKWKLRTGKFTVLGVGQLQHRKGVLDFAELARKLPYMQFVWAGGFSFGKLSSGYEEIEELQKNPPENLTFLGMIERDEMNEVYNLADVLFQPSYEELFPMTILEAMCCGLPLLLRDLELYEGILKGFYLQGCTNEDFEKILCLLEEKEEVREYAKHLSENGNKYYSKEKVLAMWDAFYTEICKGTGEEIFYKRLWRKATKLLH